ncbi:MAG: peptidyl-prolyl cis-trans isomerase [Planctomycetes bacterium]|nr:peptidyl-prolyl cis-trans isomerase [Planctomycetota bacterium]
MPPACLLLALLLASPQSKAIDDVLATVNGEAVTFGDVEEMHGQAGNRFTREELLRQIVYRRILGQEAREAGISVPDERLSEVMAQRVQSAGGWDGYLTRLQALKRTPDQDRLEIRSELVVDEFVGQCLGKVPGSPHLRPHLARQTQVLPREAQEYYRQNRTLFRTQDSREVGRLLVSRSAFASPETARQHAEAIRKKALEEFGGDLQTACAGSETAVFGTMSLGQREAEGLVPEIRTYLEAAPTGVLSPIFETPGGCVVVVKLSETPGRVLSFEEAQGAVFAILGQLKWQAAREELSRDLLEEADLWPRGLFGPEPSPASSVAPDDSGK